MCGRYSMTGPNPARVQERFALDDDVPIRRRYNVTPGDDVLAVTTDREGEPRGELLRWGLVPFWAKDPKTGFRMINARAETVAEKPAFSGALTHRRCLILADGFYEWQACPDARRKQPFWITRSDGEPFAFAGLWATWHAPNDTTLRSCTIITTMANEVLAPIHDRMPVMLADADEEGRWLDAGTATPILTELLVPLPSAAVAVRAVGHAVSDARYDGSDCLDPPGPAALADPTLF